MGSKGFCGVKAGMKVHWPRLLPGGLARKSRPYRTGSVHCDVRQAKGEYYTPLTIDRASEVYEVNKSAPNFMDKKDTRFALIILIYSQHFTVLHSCVLLTDY